MVQVVVRVEEQTLNPEALRKEIDSEGCGSIVSFVGLTRGMDNGVEVEKLEFDAWEEMLPSVLYDSDLRRLRNSQYNQW